jgi:hypothetical protein
MNLTQRANITTNNRIVMTRRVINIFIILEIKIKTN